MRNLHFWGIVVILVVIFLLALVCALCVKRLRQADDVNVAGIGFLCVSMSLRDHGFKLQNQKGESTMLDKFKVLEVLAGILIAAAILLTATRDIGFAQSKATPDSHLAPGAMAKVPAPAAKPPAGMIPLTEPEKKDLEINQLEIQNLDMKIDQLRNQIMTAKAKLAQDTANLTAQFAKTHSVDMTKFRLDVASQAFVPIDEKAKADGGKQ